MTTTIRSLTALAIAAAAGAAAAGPTLDNGPIHNAGVRTIDLHGNLLGAPRADLTVFSNLEPGYTAERAFSSGETTAVFGDQLTLAGTGVLQAFSFTLFNSGSSAGALASAQVAIDFYRASDGSSIGGFTVNTGNIALGAGFYTVLNVADLAALGLVLDTTDVIVTQSLVSTVGAANRLGVVSTGAPSIGSSIEQLYIDALDVGSGPGFYNITSGGLPVPFHAGYRVVVPAPGAFALLGAGGVLAARRRR